MDKETFISTIQEIGNCEDVVERRTKLLNLKDEITKVYDGIETDKTTINTLNATISSKDEEISGLQKANYDYFNRLSAQKTDSQILKDKTGLDNPEEEKRKFEDLFNKEGRLKL